VEEAPNPPLKPTPSWAKAGEVQAVKAIRPSKRCFFILGNPEFLPPQFDAIL
jgi:hypothetical protein